MSILHLLDAFLSDPAVLAVGYALFHFAWQGLLVALLLWLFLKRVDVHAAGVRYAASCAALAAMLMLPVLTWLRLVGRLSATSSAAGTAQGIGGLPHTLPNHDPGTGSVATNLQPIWQTLSDPLAFAEPFLPHLVVLWGAGVIVMVVRLMGAWSYAYYAAVRGGEEAPAPWQARLVALSKHLRIGRPVYLKVSKLAGDPYTFGWLRPVVIVPASVLTGLPPWQIEALLVHELAHIKRHDFLVNLLQSIAEILLFYHPAVWWVSRQIRIEREHCCDDQAAATCGDASKYARALLELEEFRQRRSAFALSAAGGSLLSRIRRLVAGTSSVGVGSRRAAVGVGGLVMFILCTVVFVAACSELVSDLSAPEQMGQAESSPAQEHFVSAQSCTALPAGVNSMSDLKALHYSLYYEGYKNGDYQAILPNLHWILACAPAFPRNDDRNFARALEIYEGLAERAVDADARGAYLDAALKLFDTVAPVLKKAQASVNEQEWVQRKSEFMERHRAYLEIAVPR